MRSLALLLIALVAAPAAAEEAPSVDDLLAKMAKAHDGLTALTATFTQTSTGMSYVEPLVQSGTIALEAPGKMRWEFVTPTPTSWVSDGTTLWVLDPAEKTSTKFSSVGPVLKTYYGFLTGTSDPRKAFTVSVAKAKAPIEGAVGLALKPKENDGSVDVVRLWLDGTTHRVTGLSMVTPFGDTTDMVLSDVKTPKDLPDPDFVWAEQEGWRVIRGD